MTTPSVPLTITVKRPSCWMSSEGTQARRILCSELILRLCTRNRIAGSGKGFFLSEKVHKKKSTHAESPTPLGSVEKHFQERTAEPQISPLRYASVEMTKERLDTFRKGRELDGRRQELFSAKTADLSTTLRFGWDDKGRAVTFWNAGDLDGRS